MAHPVNAPDLKFAFERRRTFGGRSEGRIEIKEFLSSRMLHDLYSGLAGGGGSLENITPVIRSYRHINRQHFRDMVSIICRRVNKNLAISYQIDAPVHDILIVRYSSLPFSLSLESLLSNLQYIW